MNTHLAPASRSGLSMPEMPSVNIPLPVWGEAAAEAGDKTGLNADVAAHLEITQIVMHGFSMLH